MTIPLTGLKISLGIPLLMCSIISLAQTDPYPNKELNYPIWPSCEKSSAYIAEQKNCTEEAFATFLRAKINWAEVSTTPIARAQVYLSIDYTGNVSGYGIINCRDTQLAKQMLSALSQVPTGWLPGNQSNIFNSRIDQVQLIDARIYAELFWGTQTLDSLHFYKLIGVARDSYKYYEATAVGDFLDYPGQVEVLIKQLNEDEKISKRLKKKPNVQDSLTLRGMMSSNGLIDSIQIRQSSDNKLTNATIHLLQSIPWTPIDYYGFDQPRIFFAKFGFKRKIRYPKGAELFSIRPNGFMFPDGSAEALRFIHKNLEIPSNLTDSNLVSPIFNVQLFFNPDGHIYYYRFKESVHPIIDQRIAAILVAGPAWETKRMNGKNYRAVMELTYRVQIEP